MVNWDLIKKLIQMVKDEDITGLSVEEEGVKYEVKRERGGIANVASRPDEPQSGEQEEHGMVAITAPMVGTFYRSPSPETPPFVEVGDEVEAGKVVCIIEAMKLFNEIEAEVGGKLIAVLAENGKPVEYGQKLMLVKKS